MFYDQYGMGEQCYLKYNDGQGIKIKVSDTALETQNE